jgi:hypothetical protein
MKNLLIAAFLIFTYNMVAQSIECPADQLVHLFDLDESYSSYGTPTFSGPDTYDIIQSVTVIDNSCQGAFGIETTLSYQLVNTTTQVTEASCDQVIRIQRPLSSEFTFPVDYSVAEATLEELAPNITGDVEPAQFLNGNSTFASSYSDQIINQTNGVKILRTWILLDWCNAQTIEQTQIVEASFLISFGSGPLSISTCDSNKTTEADNVLITTDAPNFTIDYGTCANTSDNITEFVNCVAANNDIPTASSFIVEIVKDGDDLNGVSTLDLVLTQRHILGQQPLNDDCKVLAADVNNDNRVSAIDLLESRKLILGIYSTLPQSNSWRFYNAGYTTQSQIFINDGDFRFDKSEFPLIDLDVKAVKVGDVNNSAQG